MRAGAELANVLNEAALETVRRGGDLVTKADIYNGMDRILQVPLLAPCTLPFFSWVHHCDHSQATLPSVDRSWAADWSSSYSRAASLKLDAWF